MEKVLIFGGLSRWGSIITDNLLVQGFKVTVPHLLKDKEAEARALAFGRNAQFEKVGLDSRSNLEWIESGQDADTILFFDAYFYDSIQETLSQLINCITHCHHLNRIVLVSHLDIYGEPKGEIDETTQVAPMTALGKRADALEQGFIKTFLEYRNEATVNTLIILRLPDLFDEETRALDSAHQEILHVKDASDGVLQALTRSVKSGIHVIQLSSGERIQKEDRQISYSNKKAEEYLGYNPQITRDFRF